MREALFVLAGTLLVGTLLFFPRSPARTLAVWRWTALAWTALFLLFALSPFEFVYYDDVTWLTIAYCLTWLSMLVVGDICGYLAEPKPAATGPAFFPLPRAAAFISLAAIPGAVMLLRTAKQRLAMLSDVNAISALRLAHAESSGSAHTIAVVLTLGGLAAFLLGSVAAILDDRRIPLLAWCGLLASIAVTVVAGGRQGVILVGVAFIVAVAASMQLRKTPYRHGRVLVALVAGFVLLASVYVTVVAERRALGWKGGLDAKITYLNERHSAVVDDDFRESVQQVGPIGYLIVEAFYYFAPNLYGLEHSLKHYDGPRSWGLLEAPYLARRLDNWFGWRLLERIGEADRFSYERFGLASNFFRTAAHTTFFDFGVVLSLPVVFAFGFVSGMIRRRVVVDRDPLKVAFLAMFCAGGVFSIILSPFAELGFAFPLLWLLLVASLRWVWRALHAIIAALPTPQGS